MKQSIIVIGLAIVLCYTLSVNSQSPFPPVMPAGWTPLELSAASEYDFLKSPRKVQRINLFDGDHGSMSGTFIYSNQVVVNGVPGVNFETSVHPLIAHWNKLTGFAFLWHETTLHNYRPGNKSAISVLSANGWGNYKTSGDFPTIDSWSDPWTKGLFNLGYEETIMGYKCQCFDGITFDMHLAKCKGPIPMRACFISAGRYKGKPIYIRFTVDLVPGVVPSQDFIWWINEWSDDVPDPNLFGYPTIYNGVDIDNMTLWSDFGIRKPQCPTA